MFANRAFLVLAVLAACKGQNKNDEVKVRSAAVAPTLNPKVDTPAPTTPDPNAKPEDTKKGDKSDEEWVPAENKSGAGRWKDTGVYLDGKPIAFLNWGELPVPLKPFWLKDRVGANKRPGTNDLGWRWGQQRFYRFTDYLKGLGVDISKIKEMHVYGPKFSESLIVTAKDLQSPEADGFLFRFGSNVSGKAIPKRPEGFAGGRAGDKISALMIYIDKKPPTLTPDGFELDGEPQYGVPYFGEPIRGGVRVYFDNRYAAIIKRQELDPKKATKDKDGELVWNFNDLLKEQGVDTSKVAEIWLVRDEKRAEKFPGTELPAMVFRASAQAKGGVLLTEKQLRANAIALHSKPVDPKDLPFITADDD